MSILEKKHIKLSNNETLYYIEKNQEAKQTILFVHGNMSSSYHYKPLIEHFEKDYHVVAPDLRGFGDSTYHQAIDSLEDFADDLALLMEALALSKVILVGWSTGGGIGLKFAAKYPDSIEKLVLLESASFRGYPIFKKDDAYQPILTELYQTKEAMAKDPVQVLPALNAMQNNDANFMKQVWQAAIYNVAVPEEAFDANIKETLKQRNLVDVDWALMTFNMSHSTNGVVEGDHSIDDVTCPVLSVWGKKDLVILESMFQETVDALPQAKTHIFEHGSHSPLTDDKAALIKVIEDFIQ